MRFVKRGEGPLYLEARGRLGGHGDPRRLWLGIASYPLQANSSYGGNMVGKNTILDGGWYYSKI